MSTSEWHRIRVQGDLGDRWAYWFEGLVAQTESSGETVLVGPIVDQAALYGVLIKIRYLNLKLISVESCNQRTRRLIQERCALVAAPAPL